MSSFTAIKESTTSSTSTGLSATRCLAWHASRKIYPGFLPGKWSRSAAPLRNWGFNYMNLDFMTLFLLVGMWYMLSTCRHTSANTMSIVLTTRYPFSSIIQQLVFEGLSPRQETPADSLALTWACWFQPSSLLPLSATVLLKSVEWRIPVRAACT